LLYGVLDHRFPVDPAKESWHFSAMGDGHDVQTWSRLIGALRAAGHDSVMSIEHEDPRLSPEVCIERSVRCLTEAFALLDGDREPRVIAPV
jgi:sugar phosphate isomerase/epimerase